MKTEWILCPVCGNKTRTMIQENTEMKKLSSLLPEMQKRNNHQCSGYENHACRQQIIMYAAAMGNTITAVFPYLSAISVNGFFALSLR